MELCDAHLHYGDAAILRPMAEGSPVRERYPCYRTVQFGQLGSCAELLRRHGVSRSVALPFVFREVDARKENKTVLRFAAENPELILPYALLDESDLEFLDTHRRELVGVKEHFIRNESVLTPEKRPVFERVNAYGLTFLLHSERLRRKEYVETLVREFPGMKIQVAHMGRGMPGDTSMILEMMAAFAPYECVSFDTSTIRDSAVLGKAVSLVGADRILYGSDFPFYTGASEKEDIMDAQIRQVLDAPLTDDQRERIFSGNFKDRITRGA